MSSTVHLIDPVPRHDPAAGSPLASLPRPERQRRTQELVAELAQLARSSEGTAAARGEEIRGQLVELNMPVASSIAQRYRSRGLPLEDLQQVAYLALTKAVGRYDPAAGHALLSFCVPTIRGELRRWFRDHGWMVRPPRRVQELQPQVVRAQNALSMRLGRPASDEEVALELDQPLQDIREAMGGEGCFSPASLDRPVASDLDASTLGELLPDEDHDTGASEARLALAPVVRRLGGRDRQILRMRFFDGLTQQEIAEDIGVTQMQVSRLLARILRDLRRDIGSLEPQDEAS